jgi:hypothetical protein
MQDHFTPDPEERVLFLKFAEIRRARNDINISSLRDWGCVSFDLSHLDEFVSEL